MNLLAKRAGWLIASVAILFWGCKEDVGIELPPDVQRTEVKYQEFTLPVTNVYFDSLRTDSRGVAFLGDYSDATYGNITAELYTEYRYKSGSIEDEIIVDRGDYEETIEDITFESVTLKLDVDDVLTNATQLSQEIDIQTLQDTIFASGLYFRQSMVPSNASSGTINMILDQIDTIDFSNDIEHTVLSELPSTLANFILNTFEEDSSSMRPLGIKLSSTSSNGIFSFDMNSDSTEIAIMMRGNLYDTLGDIKKDTLFAAVTFRLNSAGSNYFTHVDRDPSGSTISGAVDKTEFDSDPSFAFYNSLAGVYPKVDLTEFIEFSEGASNVLFNRVALEIGTEDNVDFIPNNETTQFYFSDLENSLENINWPNYSSFPEVLSVVMQSDGRYASSSSTQASPVTLAYSEIDDETSLNGFLSNQILFWQLVYDNARDDFEGVNEDDRPFIRSSMIGIDNLVLVPGQALYLGRNTIPKESVKLKVYYTQLR